jgi:hypothetical protein
MKKVPAIRRAEGMRTPPMVSEERGLLLIV